MKPSKITMALTTAVRARQPVHLWGAPGIGKSSITIQLPAILDDLIDKPGWEHFKQHATEDGWQVIDIRAAQFDPLDLRGIPYADLEELVTKWLTPGFWPTEGVGIIFLDELSGAPLSVQLALYQLVLDKRLGEYELPPGWVIIAAGNREKDRAVVQRMSTALANRFIHLDVDIDHDDWFVWAAKNNIHPSIIAFHKFRETFSEEPSLLFDFDPTADAKAFPTPRTWEYVSHTMWAEPPAEVEFEMIAGTVGEGAAREYVAFLAVHRDLPDLEMIEKHPETTMLPKEPSASVAVAMALVNRATVFNMDALTLYMKRLSPEYTALFIKGAQSKEAALMECTEVVKWATDEKNIELFRAA
jgi:hypothetical protein